MYLPPLIPAILPVLSILVGCTSSSPTPISTTPETNINKNNEQENYGYWNLELFESFSPSGWRKNSVRTEYWTPKGTLGPVVYCADETVPPGGGGGGGELEIGQGQQRHTPCNYSEGAFAVRLVGSDGWTSCECLCFALLCFSFTWVPWGGCVFVCVALPACCVLYITFNPFIYITASYSTSVCPLALEVQYQRYPPYHQITTQEAPIPHP
jgi:hypothetical protein